ncbi:MAG: orotate phosphoribosyltransferase [Alphaproteobacteria bacterium]|nr:orotate phosphoribosyltransferase [Alphaproteobacteria bacterium]
MNLGAELLDKKQIANVASRILLEVKAAYFNAERPFIFTSGWASPVYIDCRKLISYPRARQALIDFSTTTILREVGFEQLDAVAGGETAGIPFAAWIADRMQLPMLYVRKQPKGFGRLAQIEGALKENWRGILVEDLTTDGRSKVNFCKALRNAGASVEHAFVLFHYGIFPHTAKIMQDIGITLHYLATWWDVVEAAEAGSYFDQATIDEVKKFLADPIVWSREHGGIAEYPG